MFGCHKQCIGTSESLCLLWFRRPSGIPSEDYNVAAGAEAKKMVSEYEKQYTEVCHLGSAHLEQWWLSVLLVTFCFRCGQYW